MTYSCRSGFLFILLTMIAIGESSASAQTEKITNGGFDSSGDTPGSLPHWTTSKWGGEGTINSTRDSSEPLSGTASARIEIGGDDDPASNQWYYLNVSQHFSVAENHTYVGTYKARASEPVTIAVQLNEVDPPHRNIAWTEVHLDVGVQTLRVVGPSEFSGKGQILFHFGKVRRGVHIWLDEVSVLERPAGPRTARVTVDFTRDEPTAKDLSGLLLGLKFPDWAEPRDELIKPLKAKHWRVRPDEVHIGRVAGLGSIPLALLSEGWYPTDFAERRPEPPWRSEERMQAWRERCKAVARANGTRVIYDIWNEPDHPTFFTNWPDGTWENYLLTFREAHNAIREVVPDAVITGPGTSADFPWPLLEQFMDYCLAEGLTVQILATHLFGDSDSSFEKMRDDLLKMREKFIDNPVYAAVGVEQYMATEYANPLVAFRPGSIVAMLRFMEEGLVDGAIRATWDVLDPGGNTAFDGSLGGLLTSDLELPRAIWWALKWYADGAGQRVAAISSNEEIIPLASLNPKAPSASQILLGSRAFGGPAQKMDEIQVSLNGLVSAGIAKPASNKLPVWVYLAANDSGSAAYPEPILVKNFNAPVYGESASFTLAQPMSGYDALLIRFGKAKTLDFQPVQLRTEETAEEIQPKQKRLNRRRR